MGKIDAGLQLALSQASAERSHGFEHDYDLTVLVQQPLTALQVREFVELGIAADDQRTVFAGRSTQAAIEKLARKRCVKRVSLAQTLDLLSLAGMKPG